MGGIGYRVRAVPGSDARHTELLACDFTKLHASWWNSAPWQAAPTGRRWTKCPLMLSLNKFHSLVDGQQDSCGRHRQRRPVSLGNILFLSMAIKKMRAIMRAEMRRYISLLEENT